MTVRRRGTIDAIMRAAEDVFGTKGGLKGTVQGDCPAREGS